MTLKNKLKLSAIGLATSAVAMMAVTAEADIVHLDDVIIQFSLCVGNDCVNGESFGFDTLRLKENNVRMHFDDTSTSASFPRNDWRFIANDSSNGGSNYMAIEDSTAGRQVFRVDAGAPANALRVDSAGDVGIGTSNPVVDLHVVSGNTPTMRLEQNGSSGFAAQTFDVAANEANFFVRDVTNGSALSLRIFPGADQNSLVVAANNDIGMGIQTPLQALHIRRSSDATIYAENTTATSDDRPMFWGRNAGGSQLVLEDADNNERWRVTGKQALFTISDANNNPEFQIDPSGNVTITGAITTTGGTCGSGCDEVFSADYDMPSIEEHAAEMFENKYLPNVGPTPENAPINVSDKLGRMLNELEKAHIYIADLNEQNKSIATENAELKARLDRLEAKLQ